MNWLLGVNRQDKKIRKSARAQVVVEGLEDRSLMTAFTLADTLNARDTINIQELNVIQSIEQLRLGNSAQLQQVIANGQARTNQLVGVYFSLLQRENFDRFTGNFPAVFNDQFAERATLMQIQTVRVLMQKATVTSNTVDSTLSNDESQVKHTFNNTQVNLSHGNNPFLTIPHAINAVNFLGLQAQQHARTGATIMNFLNNEIIGPVIPLTPILPF